MRLTRILETGRCTVTTEFLPPRGPTVSDLVDKVRTIVKEVDAVNIPELRASFNSVPSYRMNSFFTAWRVRERCGVETVFHLTPRDANRNAIQGIIRAAADAGLQNILVIGGDKYDGTEEATVARNVFDFTGSVQLIRAIADFNREFFDDKDRYFCVAAGANPSVIYARTRGPLAAEVARMIERQDAGAELAQTQPVFDLGCLDFVDEAKAAGVKMPIMLGVIPLKGVDDALRIESRFGIIIPDGTKRKLKEVDSRGALDLTIQLVRNLAIHGIRNLHIYPREQPAYVSQIGTAFREGHGGLR